MQNSQRVLLAMPRTAPVARRRDGDIAPYRNGARQWGPHHGTGQWGPQRDAGGAHDHGAQRGGDAAVRGADGVNR